MIDVLVAGGGPAGLATALQCTRLGLDTVVLEPRPGPVDKACGEGLTPAAAVAVADLVGAGNVGGVPLRGIRYLQEAAPGAEQLSAEARYARGEGRGVRRTDLHGALDAAVRAAGIRVQTGQVREVHQDCDRVTAGGMSARYLVAADGLHSPIRAALGLDRSAASRRVSTRTDRRPPRYGLRRHFAVRPWTDLVEVHWSCGAEAYVTPVGPELVGVAVLTSQRRPFEAHLRDFTQLAERLPAHAATQVRGAGPLLQRATAPRAGRVLLVGDAAGYVDALTGEGIALSLACARSLARCLAAGRPEAYEQAWRRESRRYRLITQALLWAGRRPAVRRSIVPAAHRLPGVFAAAVNQLAGSGAPR